jgi:hypothetical protein
MEMAPHSVADPDSGSGPFLPLYPGSGAFLTPVFGNQKSFSGAPDPKPIFLRPLTIFWVKHLWDSLSTSSHFCVYLFKNKII